jgi:hypothetical protein
MSIINSSNQILSSENRERLENTRNRLFIFVAALSIICVIIIFFSGTEIRIIFINLPETISAGLALVFSIVFLLLHKKLRNGEKSSDVGKIPSSLLPSRPTSSYEIKVHIPFSIGVALWFAAELIYSYYEIGLRVQAPFPSVADPVYLLGYGFFVYSFYKMLNYLKQSIDHDVIVLASIAVCVSLSFILYLSMGIGQIMTPLGDQLTDILSVTYAVLDGVLFVPGLVILWSIKTASTQENLIYSHWIFVSAFVILNAIGDVGYGYNAIVGSLVKNEWIWNMFFNTAYITIAVAVFWQVRHYQFLSRLIQIKENIQREEQAYRYDDKDDELLQDILYEKNDNI